jgi:hypothetical protein
MLDASDDSVYPTDLEHNGVVRWNAASKKIEPVITDKRLRLAPSRTNSGKSLASKNPIYRSG